MRISAGDALGTLGRAKVTRIVVHPQLAEVPALRATRRVPELSNV